ncbi:MAG: phosphogluconate dehydratase [Gammaproteobacteria bacterium]|nr:phosphogluconate dehydratase [Gammaproteobacteria bacterium]
MHPKLQEITNKIIEKSEKSRSVYLKRLAEDEQFSRLTHLSCGNLAHGVAGCSKVEQQEFLKPNSKNFGIISAYNDVLSAHEPFQFYPKILKEVFTSLGATSQFAGGVPAMCDGVTQGQVGMEMSLFSRDLIAQSVGIALSHKTFDGALMLGICDKIVPGLIIGGLQFGHLPMLMIPGGPMSSGLPNKEKIRVRQEFAAGKVGKDALMQAEMESYHSPGTCTFYGTANTNQMVVEAMGIQLPGSSFVPPYTPLRDAYTREAAHLLNDLAGQKDYAFGRILDERSIVNGLVALMASGGSTNHTIHMIAIARAAGIKIDWSDFDAISSITPLLAKIYPNGPEDINAFAQAGGTSFLFSQLLDAGLMHDIPTVTGKSFAESYSQEGVIADEANPASSRIAWQAGPTASSNEEVLSTPAKPFDPQGGLRLMSGNVGRGIVKNSAVAKEHHFIEGPAFVFNTPEALEASYKQGRFTEDCVLVLRYQGPKACGIPELHGLMPVFGNLLDSGLKIALVTDGRMSGASGKVPIVLHTCPEALDGGPIARIQDGDRLRVDMDAGSVEVLNVSDDELNNRIALVPDLSYQFHGTGRALFQMYRQSVSPAEEGATTFPLPGEEMH